MALVTDAQKTFWDKILDEKDFPPGTADVDTLRTTFAGLNKKSGSEWIDKALSLPDKGAEDEQATPPPF